MCELIPPSDVGRSGQSEQRKESRSRAASSQLAASSTISTSSSSSSSSSSISSSSSSSTSSQCGKSRFCRFLETKSRIFSCEVSHIHISLYIVFSHISTPGSQTETRHSWTLSPTIISLPLGRLRRQFSLDERKNSHWLHLCVIPSVCHRHAHGYGHHHGHGHDRCLAHDHSRHDNGIPVDEGKNMITSHRWPSFMRTLPITPNQEGCPLIPQFSMGVIMGTTLGRAQAICRVLVS